MLVLATSSIKDDVAATDLSTHCGYNVPMTTIAAKLIRDGNSVAVRLPKTVLIMSGLSDDVQMEVKTGANYASFR